MPFRVQSRVDAGRREKGGREQNYHVPSKDRDGEGPVPLPPPPTSGTATPTSVIITGPFVFLQVGQTEQLIATVNDVNGAIIPGLRPDNWQSSVPAVATVDGNGLVTAQAAGRTSITAYSGLLVSVPFQLTVDATPASISLSPSSAAVIVPNTVQITATVKNALGFFLPGVSPDAWHSSSTGVATVNGSGLVTGVSPGTTNITATMTSPAITSSTSVVTVADLTPSSIVVAPSSATVNVSSTQQMVATVKNAEGTALTQSVDAWHSSNTGVATVNGSGLVTAVAAGTTVITATIASPSLTSNGATITVPDTVPSSIAVTPTSATVNTGATQQMTAVVKNAGGATLSTPVSAWHSSDASKATVNSSGLVTGVAGGTTTITATITSPSVTSNNVTITVQAPVDNTPAAIAISPTAVTVALNGTQQFAAVVTNAENVALSQAVSAWHSSNTTVATINSSGLLTVHAPGSTNVTATIASPSVTSNTAVVTVPDTIPASIAVTPTSSIVNAAATLQLVAVVKNAGGGTLAQSVDAWHSSNQAVATVNGSGLVTGVVPGSTTITATITSPAVTSNGVTITVPSAGGGGGPHPNEPGGFTQIFSQPFDTLTLTAADYAVGGYSIVDLTNTPPVPPVGDANAGQMFFPLNMPGGQGPGIWVYNGQSGVCVLPGTPRRLYLDFYLRLSANWVPQQSTGQQKVVFCNISKLLFGNYIAGAIFQYLPFGVDTPPWPHTQPVISAEGIVGVNDGDSSHLNAPTVQLAVNLVPRDPSSSLVRTNWNRFEILLTLNTPGQYDGGSKLWANGVPFHDYSNMIRWTDDPSASIQWADVEYNPTYGGGTIPVPNDQYMWMKNLYVSRG